MVEFDLLPLLRCAWDLIRDNRMIWLLGFLAALSGDLLSNIRIGPELNLIGDGDLLLANVLDVNSWLRALRLLGGSLVVAAGIAALLAIFVLIVVLSARAALVQATVSEGPGAAPGGLTAALREGRHWLGSLIGLTVRVYGPFLLAAELTGEILHLVPGVIRVPLYAILAALWVVGAVLPFLHTLAVCAIVIDDLEPRPALDRAWQMLTQNVPQTLVVTGSLLALTVLCRGLAHVVLQPVAGVSLLSVLLTAFRGVLPNLGQVAGLLALGGLSTALLAPAYVLTLVVLALVYARGGFAQAAA